MSNPWILDLVKDVLDFPLKSSDGSTANLIKRRKNIFIQMVNYLPRLHCMMISDGSTLIPMFLTQNARAKMQSFGVEGTAVKNS